jgi:predicted dehydrogenase
MKGLLSAGVVGLGFGANHARVLSQLPGVRLSGVCDSDRSRLQAVAGERDTSAYPDIDSLLRHESLDLVVIATPERQHRPLALKAIEAGCAVLVEKPLATSYEEGLELVQAAAAAGVPLMAGHIERFNPAVQELRRRLLDGAVGEVLHLAGRRTAPIRLRAQDVNVVHDSALHDIDAMRYVLGREVESVFAQSQTGVLQPFEDSIAAVLRFAGSVDSRAPVGSLEVNWLSPLRIRELTVLGTKGILVLDYAAQTLEFHAAAPRPSSAARDWSTEASRLRDPRAQIPIEPREQLVQELSAFVEAVRRGAPMPVSGEDALQTLAVADALTLSARSGGPVQVRRD